jgi:hypothetical protein
LHARSLRIPQGCRWRGDVPRARCGL